VKRIKKKPEKVEKVDDDDDDEEIEGLDNTDVGNKQKEHDQIKYVLSQLNTAQQHRYEYYRRSGFQRTNIKRLMQNIANCPISQTMAIVMSGITKVYVGELIEIARTVMGEWNEAPGPLRPRHIREAYRRLKMEEITGNSKYTPRFFSR